jgi:hypothetical protein
MMYYVQTDIRIAYYFNILPKTVFNTLNIWLIMLKIVYQRCGIAEKWI